MQTCIKLNLIFDKFPKLPKKSLANTLTIQKLRNRHPIIPFVGGEDIDLGDDGGLPLVDLRNFPGVKQLRNDIVDSFSDPIRIPNGLFFGDNFHSVIYVRNLLLINEHIKNFFVYTCLIGK